MVKTEAVQPQEKQENTVAKYNSILMENGLEHLIGQVTFKVQEGVLRIFPKNEYAREILGSAPHLEFHL